MTARSNLLMFIKISATVKLYAKCCKKFKDFEDYMKQTIERHVESMPRLALGSREELRAEILNGMMTTWHLVSPQFQHSW
jgi:hypothetical protein